MEQYSCYLCKSYDCVHVATSIVDYYSIISTQAENERINISHNDFRLANEVLAHTDKEFSKQLHNAMCDDVGDILEGKPAKAKKDDNGKPEAIYFYWLGLHALTDNPVHIIMDQLRYDLRNTNEKLAMKDLKNLLDIYVKSSNLDQVSIVSKFGATKYGLNNFRNGFIWSKLYNSLGRHILKEIKGEPDTDTNQPHALHTLANIFMLADHIKNNLGHNDIPELLGSK